MANDSLDSELFAQGFVAQLLSLSIVAIQPRKPEVRLGLRRVVSVLETEIRALAGVQSEKRLYMDLVRLRNELSPSNVGAFDNFETALRNLQLSATQSPNPFYEEIVFTASRSNAEATLNELRSDHRLIVEKAALAFCEEAGAAAVVN